MGANDAHHFPPGKVEAAEFIGVANGETTLRELSGDEAAVMRALSDQPVILFGHDWGAPIAYTTTLLHGEHVRALAGLSVD